MVFLNLRLDYSLTLLFVDTFKWCEHDFFTLWHIWEKCKYRGKLTNPDHTILELKL